jgi:hypothetical protein
VRVSLCSWRWHLRNFISSDGLQNYRNLILIVIVVFEKISPFGGGALIWRVPICEDRTFISIMYRPIPDKLLNTQYVLIYTTYMRNKNKIRKTQIFRSLPVVMTQLNIMSGCRPGYYPPNHDVTPDSAFSSSDFTFFPPSEAGTGSRIGWEHWQ